MALNLRTLVLFLVTGLSQLVALGVVVAASLEIDRGLHGREGRGLFLSLAAGVGLFALGHFTRREGEEASGWALSTLALVSAGLLGVWLQSGGFAMASLALWLTIPASLVAGARFADTELEACLFRALGTLGTLLVVGCTAYLQHAI